MRNHPLVFLVSLSLFGGVAGHPAARAAEPALETRAYEVSALLQAPTDAPIRWLGLPMDPAAWGDGPLANQGTDDAPPAFLEWDALRDLLEAATPGAGWHEEGRSIELRGTLLVATAPRAAFDPLERALAFLWREASRRVTLEGTWIHGSGSGPAAAAVEGPPGKDLPPDLPPAEAARLVEEARGAGAEVSRATSVVAAGVRTTLGRSETVSYIGDSGVEIAMHSVVANPIVMSRRTGWRVDARPFVLRDGGVLVEVLAQWAIDRGGRELDLAVEPHGTIELPSADVARFLTTLRISPGRVAIVALARPSASGRDLLLLRASVDPPPSPGGEPPLLRLDAGAVARTPSGWRFGPPAGEEAWALTDPVIVVGPTPDPLLEVDQLQKDVLRALGPEADESGGSVVVPWETSLYLLPRPGVAEAAYATLRHWEARLESPRFRVRVLAREGDGAEQEIAGARLGVPSGETASWAIGREHAYLADWDVEVAQEARVGDPTVRTFLSGLVGTLRFDRAPVEGEGTLDLDLGWTNMIGGFVTRPTHSVMSSVVEIPHASHVEVREHLLLERGVPKRLAVGSETAPTGDAEARAAGGAGTVHAIEVLWER